LLQSSEVEVEGSAAAEECMEARFSCICLTICKPLFAGISPKTTDPLPTQTPSFSSLRMRFVLCHALLAFPPRKDNPKQVPRTTFVSTIEAEDPAGA
jgi:hypothetical protein